MSVDGIDIKFEILLEARIALEIAGREDRICDIATLMLTDLATSKLLANSNRWADDSVFSRDLIDLAMMKPSAGQLNRAATKAKKACGDSIDADLIKATESLLARQNRLDRCMEVLKMKPAVPPDSLRQCIKTLLPRTPRIKGGINAS